MNRNFGRKDRLIEEKRHDVYRVHNKWPEPTRCNTCGALFVNGRWTWQEAPETFYQAVCPACRRISDRLPAGYIEIKGQFFEEHRAEILNLIRNTENQEKAEHPLERIISIVTDSGFPLVTTTGHHLARRIGEALARAYKGELTFHYPEAEECIRVHWQRQ